MWIVTGNKGPMVTLTSSKKVDGILPVGSYLTVVDENKIKTILLVKETYQQSLFEPSPLIVDSGLEKLSQDQECKNIILAEEIRQYPSRPDGLFSFVKPNEIARRTSQQEINEIFPSQEGYPVFLATNYLRQSSLLKDDSGNLIYVKIPYDSLYLQTMICGQTGSGKTVAMKYLIEQFRLHENGAVLAVNVKSTDLLTMDQPTEITNRDLLKKTKEEWKTLNLKEPSGEYSIYVPYSGDRRKLDGVNESLVSYITLKTKDLEPDALLGILRNITERSAEALPNIFRYWKDKTSDITFRNFIKWFKDHASSDNHYLFPTLSRTGDPGDTTLHPATCDAIIRSLDYAKDFFDNTGECLPIREENILVNGKLSVIDLARKDTIQFGAILLRHLLRKIYDAKAKEKTSDVPILIIIDEVHQFYGTGASKEALEELNMIARMGRSEKIGVIFASQNPKDLPEGVDAIVNTRIFFRSLEDVGRKFDIKDTRIELSSLESGFAMMSNVSVPEIRFVKFPIPLRGVKS